MTMNVPAPPELIVEQVNAGGVSCLWARMPGTPAERTILYLHGGAYVVGSAIGYLGFAVALSRAADARVLLVDYRLAAENPHQPTPRQRRPGRTPAGSSSPHFPEDHTRQTKVRRKASVQRC
jgi:hypothetical protein